MKGIERWALPPLLYGVRKEFPQLASNLFGNAVMHAVGKLLTSFFDMISKMINQSSPFYGDMIQSLKQKETFDSEGKCTLGLQHVEQILHQLTTDLRWEKSLLPEFRCFESLLSLLSSICWIYAHSTHFSEECYLLLRVTGFMAWGQFRECSDRCGGRKGAGGFKNHLNGKGSTGMKDFFYTAIKQLAKMNQKI